MKVRVTNVTACAGGEHLTVTATINDGPTRTLQTAKATIARAGAADLDEAKENVLLLLRQEILRAGVQNGTGAQMRSAVINKDYYV